MPNGIGPTSSADLTNLCLPWDNDEAGLLENVPAPRECMVPHPVISPEAMYDDDANVKPLEPRVYRPARPDRRACGFRSGDAQSAARARLAQALVGPFEKSATTTEGRRRSA